MRVMILLNESLSQRSRDQWGTVAAEFAELVGEPVMFAEASGDALDEVAQAMERSAFSWNVELLRGVAPEGSVKIMSSAPFVYREDGRPDWQSMWGDFCELALYGGPPHRGEEDALHAVIAPATAGDGAIADSIVEIRRGIFETTGLFAEPAEDGWLAVSCDSTKMAAWLCATILLENVDARCEGERLYLPASPDFTLKNEVKSVITVLAKTHHYWEEHIAGARPRID